MKKRLFVLFMAAVVGFTGMPMTFANAADDVVTTTEGEQPDACKTISGNYGVTIDKDKTKFKNCLTDELSKKIYDIFVDQLITNPWKERKDYSYYANKGKFLNIDVVNISVSGSYEANSGKYVVDTNEDPSYITEARDNFVAATYNALNVLMNTYPNELAGLDLNEFMFSNSSLFSTDATKTDVDIMIFYNEYWDNSYVDYANKAVSSILEEADNFVKDKSEYKDNPDIGRIVYFDQWLVNNIEAVSDEAPIYNTQYGVFYSGKATDEGYALAMSTLLDKLGYENEVVFGTTNFDETSYGYWNIVKIKDSFYIIDSYGNDVYTHGSYYSDKVDNKNRPYLLVGKAAFDYGFYPVGNGKFYTNKFIDKKIVSMSYSAVSEGNYFVSNEFDNAVVLAKKKSGSVFEKTKLKEYNRAKATYVSSDSNIVSVSKKGKLKAKAPGKVTITIKKDGSEAVDKVDVYVYEIESLQFSNNTSVNSQACQLNDSFYIGVNVKFTTNTSLSAKQVQNVYNVLNKKKLKVTAKSSKKKAVQVSEPVLLGNYMYVKVNVTSAKKCKAKITLYYGTKKANCTLEVGSATASN